MLSSGRKEGIKSALLKNKALFIVILLAVIMGFLSPVFFTVNNIMNVLRQVCVATIVACGFSMILGLGDIDLSVGSTMGLTGIVMAMLMVRGVPVVLAILAGVVLGVLIGVVNAFFITRFGLVAFIVTMATQQVIRGSCYLITGMLPITNLPESFVVIGQGYVGAIPIPVFIMILMVAVSWILINRTKFGRYLLAMGGNPQAALVSGINIVKVRYQAFMLSGAIASIAGLMLTSRAASAQPSAGLNMEMDAIAASVIGGTAMNGGKVNMIGAFFGALLVGVVNNGLNLMGVDSNWQTVSKGILIIIAVVLDVSTTWILEGRKKK